MHACKLSTFGMQDHNITSGLTVIFNGFHYSFKMKVSIDGEKYTWYRDSGGRRTFQGNKGNDKYYYCTY